MMKTIACDMHQVTGVFHIKNRSQDGCSVLDMCMAPGGFLAIALSCNPQAQALAFSLPKINGGHSVLLPKRPNVTLKFLDVTMLAEDMGLPSIPHEHPDARNFLPSQFDPRQSFDLIICDGQVLRNHDRASYRERTEASRLSLAQLTLALDHMNPGGTMIVLLHKVEALATVQLLYTFDKFASVQLFKHTNTTPNGPPSICWQPISELILKMQRRRLKDGKFNGRLQRSVPIMIIVKRFIWICQMLRFF
jgi:23S rRNA U2552 (ribose-2'-O)-methylase RlmE/FtsJ